MTAITKEETPLTKEQTDELITAIRRIAHGDQHGPTGLEMLAMAIGGEGPGWGGLPVAIGESSEAVAEALRGGLESIAGAIREAGTEVAEAIRDAKEEGRQDG